MALPTLQWDEKKKEWVPGTKPKLQPACQVVVTEGMEVFAKSPEALKAQESTQEFLLLNHPVDCPICDQAGECKLQDYWLTSQKKLKRKRTEPVHKPKGVRFGPTIVYDADFASLLLAEDGSALVVVNGVGLDRWDVSGATATLDWNAILGAWPESARPDAALPGSYLVALGFGGSVEVP